MSRPLIIVHVSPTGQTQVRAEGFRGQDCLTATRELEQSLGLAVSRQHTGQFYQANEAASRVELQSGERTE
ncbi:MAG: DUF2997 domain-containing protein [Pirellulaceae bacterium]|nr:DUF2997 domain-containing protein [Pirellulaceae bacterium]